MPKHNFGQNLKFEIAGVSLKKKAQDQGNLNLINSFPSPNSVSMQDPRVHTIESSENSDIQSLRDCGL